MEALAATPRDLARTLRRIDDVQAEQRFASDGWSIRDIITRLCDEEALYVARWQRVVTGDTGAPASMHPLDAEPSQQRSLADLVTEWTARRNNTLAFLSGLEQQEWGITVVRDGAPVRLREDVQALVTHDNEHLNQILELREAIET